MTDQRPLPVDPASSPDIRLSDRERDAVAEFLRHHAGEGRLTMLELEDRLSLVYGAKVRSDLEGVGDGLPLPNSDSSAAAPVGGKSPVPRVHDRSAEIQRRTSGGLDKHVRTYLVFCVFFVILWAITGAGYFWPIWPILGWGVGVASHWASCQR